MKKLIKKLRQIFKLNQVVYVIEYTNPLDMAQFTTIINKMITKFSGGCSPNNISGMPNSAKVRVTFSSDCMTIEELTRVGNITIQGVGSSNPVKSVTISQY